MKRTTQYILALSCIAFAGCQKIEAEYDRDYIDGTVRYAVATGDAFGTKSAYETGSQMMALSSSDGDIVIPMRFEATEGIDNVIPSEAALTKGTLVNTTGNDEKTLSEFTSIVSTFIAKAYDDDDNEKVSQTVTWSDNKWDATPTTYWEENTNLNFLAYANLPASQTAAITSEGVTTSHTVPATAGDQTDILFGHYSGDGEGSGTAEIRFEHPLTAVRFLRGEMDEDLVIKSISLKGVAESGTATMTPAGAISWSDVDGHDYTVSQTDDSGLALSNLSGYSDKLIGEPFIIIPQDLTEDKVEVQVTLTDDIVVTAELSTGEWKAGFTNTYIISTDVTTTLIVSVDDEVSGNVKTDPVISNCGTMAAYLRVAIVGFWINSSDEIVCGWNEAQGTFENFPGEDWVKGADGLYYYIYPLNGVHTAPIETGTKLFTKYTAPAPPVEGATLEMDIVVQGIAYDSEKAIVNSAWGNSAAALLNDTFKE